MFDNYIVEIRPKSLGITVQAGIVVRDGQRFRFFAATHAFHSLEGRLFKTPRAAESAALRHIAERASRVRAGAVNSPQERHSNPASYQGGGQQRRRQTVELPILHRTGRMECPIIWICLA